MMTLYIFDKDRTLIKPRPLTKGLVRTPVKPKEQKLKKGRVEKLAELRAAGHTLALASNQPIVARGLITMEQAKNLMADVAAKAGGMSTWRFCPYSPKAKKKIHGRKNPYARDDHCRKPHPGMIEEIMQELGFAPEDTIMVGDKKQDRKAAQNAGVKFIKAKKFFKKAG